MEGKGKQMDPMDGRQDGPYSGEPGSSIDLNVSVLTDRDGSAPALMDKAGIHIFDAEGEARIQHYIQTEHNRLLFYKKEVFEGKTGRVDHELQTIKEQVFAITASSNHSFENRNAEMSEKSNIVWIMLLPIICIYISLSYRRFKKKEREKRIADIDNCYDE